MSALEDYQGRVEALLTEAEHCLTPRQVQEPWHLAEHGEPAEGLAMLAWIISEGQVQVDRGIIEGIRELSAGLVDATDLPPDLDEWIRS